MIVIVGPTGVGKTEVALAVAERLSGEVISADSRQVYRELSAGTAKPPGEWTKTRHGLRYIVRGVIHHLVDHVTPIEPYTAGRFVREAGGIIEDLIRRGVPSVLVGGTGLYLRSLTRGLAVLPEGDPAIREELTLRADREGRSVLHQELSRVDPESASAIPSNNIQRVIRALEVHRLTGRPLSALQDEGTHPSPFDFAWFGLKRDPSLFQEHLKNRCRAMEEGLLDEIKILLNKGIPRSAPAFQSLGYKEAIAFESRELSREAFGQELYRKTRLYSKRQLTWFRAEPILRWIELSASFTAQDAANHILSLLK